MAAFDYEHQQNRSSDGQTPASPPLTALDAYGLAARETSVGRGDQLASNDRTIIGRAGDGQALSGNQQAMLGQWHADEPAILAFNARNDADGGAHLQNAVYMYARRVLKEQGLDKAGWDVYPVAMHSPLDKIGADIALINNRTGALVFMDPSSRRLDPRTGERASSSDSAKNNVPALREPGVVDALPRWFDRTTGNLELDQGDVAMNESVRQFKEDFSHQMHDLTTSPAPFNMKDFPLPYMGTKSVDQTTEVAQIQAVVDWAAKAGKESARQGDYGMARMQQEFGNALGGGALNFSKRTGSERLSTETQNAVNKVIADEALRRAYPDLARNANDNSASPAKRSQVLQDGSQIKVDKENNLIVNLRNPGGAAQDQVITGGSVTDKFRAATNYWVSAQHNSERKAEFTALLPKSVQKEIANGHLKVEKILAEIGNDRNAFSGGGAGVDKPLVTRVVSRLAAFNADGLRRITTSEAPGNAAQATTVEAAKPTERSSTPVRISPAAVHQQVGRTNGGDLQRPKEIIPASPPSITTPTKNLAPVPAPMAKVETPPSHLGRPQSGTAGGAWQPGVAPAPIVGKTDRPADKPVAAVERPAPVVGGPLPAAEKPVPAAAKGGETVIQAALQRATEKAPENALQAAMQRAAIARAQKEAEAAPKPVEVAPRPVERGREQAERTEHLTPAELKTIERARLSLESKGQSNLSEGDKEQIASFRFAEAQLSKPLGGDPVKVGIVEHLRGLMGREARGAALSAAMLSVVLMDWYNASKPQVDDSNRSKFY
ncbi:MAG: hypothetical protein KGS72_00085 [Cyanobacteria bacterium REEB67]|nr:hypothetical protein [Cyanobacteria bacterium REEB67]